MKERILQLRKEGKTYDEIKEETGCSKGTISYHCGEGQREKSKLRLRKNAKVFKNYILKRISYFQKRNTISKNYDKSKEFTFTVEDFLKKFGDNPKCGLTGLPIDLSLRKSWHLDHIVPLYKGGDNSLDNCQILLTDINQMKGKLTVDELLSYCKLIIENN